MHNENMTFEWRRETEREYVKEKGGENYVWFFLKKEAPAMVVLLTQASKSAGYEREGAGVSVTVKGVRKAQGWKRWRSRLRGEG